MRRAHGGRIGVDVETNEKELPEMLNANQAKALQMIVAAVLEAIQAAGPTGAPGGVLYAALMAQGCSKSQFDSLMAALVSTGKVRRDGDVYHATTGVN